MRAKAFGIDFFNTTTPVLSGHGDGKALTLAKDCMVADYTGKVLLPQLLQQRTLPVSSEKYSRWNSGMKLSYDAGFFGNCARVPVWALMEMLKKDQYGLVWEYSRSNQQFHSVSIQEIISAFFRHLHVGKNMSQEDLTVVTIPDRTSSWGQETMLRSMGDRNTTRLLWRSVAAVLGLNGITTLHEKSRIAVLDLQPHEANITILEMRMDSQNGEEMLVPVRHLPKSPYYFSATVPPLDLYHAEAILTDHHITRNTETIWFLSQVINSCRRLDANKGKSVPVFDGKMWKFIDNFKTASLLDNEQTYTWMNPSWIEPAQALLKAGGCSVDMYNSTMMPGRIYEFIRCILAKSGVQFDHVLCCGPYLKYLDHEKIKSSFHRKQVIIEGHDTQNNLIVSGSVIFGIRAKLGLPTYFDQMPKMDIVVQDTENEEIRTDVMIKGGVVRGNEEYRLATPLTGYSIDKGEEWCKFYLQMEDAEKLRVLKQDFEIKLDRRYDISLWPSIRPAQGMARVEVRNQDIFPEPVLLDWEKMEVSDETLEGLNQKIERSFPPYIPGVKADNLQWNFRECQFHISRYTYKGTRIDGVADILGGIGLDHSDTTGLGRINVFGNNPDLRVPTIADPDLIRDFFDRLLNDYYHNHNYDHVIRTIAWTYSSEVFAKVRLDMLKKLNLNNSMKIQELTACANLFCTPTEYKAYFGRVLREFGSNIRMNNYVNCLKKMLSYNNDLLSYIDSDDCRKMMTHLLNMLNIGFDNNQPIIFKNALTAILFMLKRRRYDRQFMKYKENERLEPLLGNIIKRINEIIEISRSDMFKRKLVMTTDGNTNLALEILKFMQGKGSLMGFVSANNE